MCRFLVPKIRDESNGTQRILEGFGGCRLGGRPRSSAATPFLPSNADVLVLVCGGGGASRRLSDLSTFRESPNANFIRNGGQNEAFRWQTAAPSLSSGGLSAPLSTVGELMNSSFAPAHLPLAGVEQLSLSWRAMMKRRDFSHRPHKTGPAGSQSSVFGG